MKKKEIKDWVGQSLIRLKCSASLACGCVPLFSSCQMPSGVSASAAGQGTETAAKSAQRQRWLAGR
eukprot:scaffold106853_cov21-Tisochrysis_lutea.AAC.3